MIPFFINMILLGGATAEKLDAARLAGFDQAELWRQDVVNFPGGAAALRARLAALSLTLTDYQVLLDFDGAPEGIRDAKRIEALSMLDTAAVLGATTLLVPASTRADCRADRAAEDIAWLADEAAIRGLRIAYEAMAWSTVTHTLPAAWALVRRLARPNLGLVLDAFHLFARGGSAADLDGIPPDRIFLVQLSDLAEPPDLARIVEIARHRRLLPGQGGFPIKSILQRLKTSGYAGPVGLEVFNDAMKARNPEQVAIEAMAALRHVWSAA